MPSFVEIDPVVPEKISKGFTIYGHGGHLGHVTWIIYKHIDYPFPYMLPIKFDFDLPGSFRGEDSEIVDNGRTTTTNGRRMMAIL